MENSPTGRRQLAFSCLNGWVVAEEAKLKADHNFERSDNYNFYSSEETQTQSLPTMEGQGVTNYNADKPTYAFTAATTEFDDELIRRGIVTMEQAMVSKGASAAEAQRLAAQAQETATSEQVVVEKETNDTNSDDDSFEDDDDEFLQKYRQQRLAEMKQQHATATNSNVKDSNSFGQVIPIQRPEWTHHVNEASQNCWVVVTLTSNNPALTGSIEAAVTALAQHCPSVKFVTIRSTSAIDNWPDANLPSIFIYRHGKMQQELIQMKRALTTLQVMEELASGGVQFQAPEIESVKDYSAKVEQDRYQTTTMERRRRLMLDEEDDDDEVL